MRFLFFLAYLVPTLSCAHPHEWINVTLTPITDASGKLTAIHELWSFDPMFAETLLQPVLQAPDNAAQKKAMAKMQTDVSATLAQKSYFTFPEKATFKPAEARKFYAADGSLYYEFTLPLTTPSKDIHFKIYEPTYFVEVRYDDDNQKTQWQNGCTLKITESQPNQKMIAAASAVDITGKEPPNLGSYFAQISDLHCGG